MEQTDIKLDEKTKIDGVDGKILVSSVYLWDGEFETMVVPVKKGKPDWGIMIDGARTLELGYAMEKHKEFCDKYKVN